MTEPSTYAYPQDKVRITASYHKGVVGDHVPAGQPETVEIELNDDSVPADPAERIAFLTSLVDALFRIPPAQNNYQYQVEINDSSVDPDQLRAISGRTSAKARPR